MTKETIVNDRSLKVAHDLMHIDDNSPKVVRMKGLEPGKTQNAG